MRLVTEEAVIRCSHDGVVDNQRSQDWVTVSGVALLVDDDPERRPINRCPNIGPTVKPCDQTLKVAIGYSELLRIDGQRVVLDNLDGLTTGSPPGSFHYNVRFPGQEFVGSDR